VRLVVDGCVVGLLLADATSWAAGAEAMLSSVPMHASFECIDRRSAVSSASSMWMVWFWKSMVVCILATWACNEAITALLSSSIMLARAGRTGLQWKAMKAEENDPSVSRRTVGNSDKEAVVTPAIAASREI
jgi:hypothetical protein